MIRCAACLALCLLATSASAQQASAPAAEPSTAQAVTKMEEPLPGDRWVYEIRDEITGKVTATRENVVTEVTPSTISVRGKKLGADDNEDNLVVYDHSWNLVEGDSWRYSPHDGSGIQSPLAVGKTWPVRTDSINRTNGNTWKWSGTSKIVGQESVTTRAGTFDSFKIETSFTATNLKNPTIKNEVTSLTWYVPAIDHWVRRTSVSRTNKHLRVNRTVELVEYGGKQ